jgi:hypothetical protein
MLLGRDPVCEEDRFRTLSTCVFFFSTASSIVGVGGVDSRWISFSSLMLGVDDGVSVGVDGPEFSTVIVDTETFGEWPPLLSLWKGELILVAADETSSTGTETIFLKAERYFLLKLSRF